MQTKNLESSINKLIPKLIKEGCYSDNIPTKLYDLIVKSVYDDILKKIFSFKNISCKSSLNLEEQITTCLSKLTNEELKELFGPITDAHPGIEDPDERSNPKPETRNSLTRKKRLQPRRSKRQKKKQSRQLKTQ